MRIDAAIQAILVDWLISFDGSLSTVEIALFLWIPMIEQDDYPLPVAKLLAHGPAKANASEPWFNYVESYGLGEMDVPDLLSMIIGADINFDDPIQRHTPVHACRALGQLGDMVADSYLARLLDNHQNSELTESALVALSMLGPRTLEVLKAYFETPDIEHWSQALAADGVRIYAERNPDYRDQGIEVLSHMLSRHALNTPELNGFIVHNLVQLKATEAADVIAQAFRTGNILDEITGPWPAVQVELGLASEADFEPDELICEADLELRAARQQNVDTTPTNPPQRRRSSSSVIALAGSYSLLDHLKN